MKRALALVLALVLCLGVLAGCSEETPATTPSTNAPTSGNTPSTNATTTVPVVTTPDFGGWKLVMYGPDNKDLEEEGSYLNKLVEKHLNIDWEINEVPSGTDPIATMLAEGKIPTLVYDNGFVPDQLIQDYNDGIYINIYDYLDKMPNLKAHLESDDPKIKADVAKYTLEDGLMVAIPITQSGVATNYGYFYRADLFEKEKLTFATTQDEFYNLLKTLKTKYPASYPFVLRQLTGNMQQLSDGWGVTWGQKTHHTLRGYNGTWFMHDEAGKYYVGQTSDGYKEMAQYFVKLTNEGLLHPSSMTLDTAGWNEAFASETSFISYDKMDRIPSILAACANIQGVRLVGAAPIAMGTNGSNIVNPIAATGSSFKIGNDKATLENTLKFVDWLYSEEGITMTNWGKEGESYTVDANGKKAMKKEFIDAQGSLTLSGLSVRGLVGYVDFDSYISTLNEDMKTSLELTAPYQAGFAQTQVTLNEDEKLVDDTYGQAWYTYANGELAKFMLGQRDFSTWDAFKTELMKDYKGEELMKAHQAALDRALGK